MQQVASSCGKAEGKGVRTLVVDDSEVARNVFAFVLGLKGHSATVAESGSEAIKKVKREEFDIIFLDVVMPGLNGVETLKKIKVIKPEANVVMITGFPVEEEVKEALRLGACGCLYRPLGVTEIMKTVDFVMRSSNKNNRSVS